MENEDPAFRAIIDHLRAQGHYGPSKPPIPPLNPPGGSGSSPDMEARIAKLEAHMEHVRADLGKLDGVPATLADMKVRVEALPSKEWAFKTLAAMLACLAVIVGLIVRFLPHAG